MDPVTRAAQIFIAELNAFWEPPPGVHPPSPWALRLTAAPDGRTDLQKSLRLYEWQPESRHPLVIAEADCEDEAGYAAAISDAVEQGYEQLRQGLGEDGVDIEPLAVVAVSSAEELALQVVAAARQVARARHPVTGRSLLDGLALALFPRRVLDVQAYLGVAAALAAASDAALIRLAALDVPESGLERLLPVALGLKVDQDELLAFLKEAGSAESQGPPVDKPRMTPAQKLEVEKQLGRKLPSDDTVRLLRRLLIESAEQGQAGRPKLAVKKLRAARTLCRAEGLGTEEASVCIGLGSAYVATENLAGALAAYREAASIAGQADNRVLGAQALMGQGAVHLMKHRYEAARTAYEEAAALGDSLPALRLEAERMAGECRLAGGDAAEAARVFYQALDRVEAAGLGAAVAPGVRALGSSLCKLLRSHLRDKEADEVAARVEEIAVQEPRPAREAPVEIGVAGQGAAPDAAVEEVAS